MDRTLGISTKGRVTLLYVVCRQPIELQARLEKPNNGLFKWVLRVSELKSAAMLYKT